MSYEEIFGMIFVAFIAICGFFYSMKKTIKEERKPLEDLNKSIVELNANFKNMVESDKVRDTRITKHGLEIEDIQGKQRENTVKLHEVESKVDKNDIRISEVEKTVAANTVKIQNLAERIKQ